MKTNGRIEHVKKVGKQIKKACPVEMGLAHARTALARALGFANWYTLTKSLPAEFSSEFPTQVRKLSSDPTHPTFLAAVKRFAESSGVGQAIAFALCVEFLPPALEKWHTWKDRRPDRSEPPGLDAEFWEEPPAQDNSAEGWTERPPLLAASAGNAGVRFIAQGQSVPVVVRKKRRALQPDQ